MRITRTGESSDNHVKSSHFLDNLDDFVIEEHAIGANPYFSDRFWQFGEGTLQQRDGDRRDVGVAGMVAALPTILCVPLEAQQRKVRGAPALLGVVAHLGSFLTTIDRQHRAVEVEEHAGPPKPCSDRENCPTVASLSMDRFLWVLEPRCVPKPNDAVEKLGGNALFLFDGNSKLLILPWPQELWRASN